MTEQLSHRKKGAGQPLSKGLLLTLAESVLRPADLLDDTIRRLVIPFLVEDNIGPAVSAAGEIATLWRMIERQKGDPAVVEEPALPVSAERFRTQPVHPH